MASSRLEAELARSGDLDVRHLVLLGGGVVIGDDGGEHVSSLLHDGALGSGERIWHDADGISDAVDAYREIEMSKKDIPTTSSDTLRCAIVNSTATAMSDTPMMSVWQAGEWLTDPDVTRERAHFMHDLLWPTLAPLSEAALDRPVSRTDQSSADASS